MLHKYFVMEACVVLQCAWDDAAVVEAALPPSHSERLATSGLPIRKNGSVEALQRAIDYRSRDRIENGILLRARVERLVERKLKMVTGVVDDSWGLLHWYIKRDLALFQRIPNSYLQEYMNALQEKALHTCTWVCG
jgi:hypothetical protein